MIYKGGIMQAKIFQYIRYLVTPEEFENSFGKGLDGHAVQHVSDLHGSIKAVFWIIISIILPLAISGLH